MIFLGRVACFLEFSTIDSVIIDEIEITIKIFAGVSSTYDFVMAVLRDESQKRIQRGCEDSSGGG